MAWTDVKSVYVSAGTSLKCISGRARVRAFSTAVFATALPASIVFKNDTATTGLITVDIAAVGTVFHKLPDAGVVFASGVSITCPTSCTLTVYYDGVT